VGQGKVRYTRDYRGEKKQVKKKRERITYEGLEKLHLPYEGQKFSNLPMRPVSC